MRSVLAAIALAFVGVAAPGQVRINEVLFFPDPGNADPQRAHAWLELYNTGPDPVDLTGWSVSGRDGVNGSTARPLPAVNLGAGAYLVVHFAVGQDQLDFGQSAGHYYTGDSGYWDAGADEAALYSPAGIVDFINWARSSAAYRPGQAHLDAVMARIWTEGAVLIHDQIGRERLEMLRFVSAGDSIGRDMIGTDTDQISDFNPHGGVSSAGPTPGAQNFMSLQGLPDEEAVANARRLRAAPRLEPVQAKWTVLVYISTDNNLEQEGSQVLRRIQLAGGSNTDVNFVAMYDAKTRSNTTWRGLVPPPNSANLLIEPIGPDSESSNIGERDMGDGAQLAEFISWTKRYYPADHYGLLLFSHGKGWKGFGPDETFPPGDREKNDWLYMGELSNALAGQTFDWIAFHACLMGAIEVAHQVQPFAKYMLASEEVELYLHFPIEAMVQNLRANPNWNALDSATDLFENYVARAKAASLDVLGEKLEIPPFNNYTQSLIDLSRIPDLSTNVRAWADLLAPGMSLFQKRDDPTDNVQILTANQLPTVEKFFDKNFIDLYHFGKLMQSSGVPNCLLTPVGSILDIITNRVVIKEAHGPDHPNAHGLHIYWPRYRMYETGGKSQALGPVWGFPYDFTDTRTMNGSTPLAHYGVRQDALPLKERDPETKKDFEIGAWPLPQSPDFKFPNDTGWHKVLDRFYHPVADNRILGAGPAGSTAPVANDANVVLSSGGGGACTNPSDEITVPVGYVVFFSGAGSSDADEVLGPEGKPTHYFWDSDDTKETCGGCKQPSQIDKQDAATAKENMNEDQKLGDTPADENDADSIRFSRSCDSPRTFKVSLMTWDDNHLMPFHDTDPSGLYVHPQTRTHQAQVTCKSPITPSTFCPMSATLNLTFGVTSDPANSAVFVGLSQGMLLMTRSGPNGSQVSVSSNISQLVPASGPFDVTNCAFTISGVSTGRIAGFPNVHATYNLKLPSPNFNTVTGTYQVATQGDFMGEPPVGYSVSGTVTNPK